MGERRFHCTACGKCCHGILPLTVKDALANAGRFPLAILWTPIRKGAKAYDLTGRIGLPVDQKFAVQVTPVAYLPPTTACPALKGNGKCSIHNNKPLRCRAMPFYAYGEEAEQAEMLIPRPGWECDISEAAPLVYRNKVIVAREDFDAERRELLAQAPLLRTYGERLLVLAPNVKAEVAKAAKAKRGGQIFLKFTQLLPRLPDVDAKAFCKRQLPVLKKYAKETAGEKKLEAFHGYYVDCIAGMEGLLGRYTKGR